MSSLFFTLVLLGSSVVMGFMYISPTISEIRNNQDTAKAYTQEAGRVEVVARELSDKITTINNVSLSKQTKLTEYLPNTIDDIYVLKVLETITSSVQNVTITDMSIGDTSVSSGSEQVPTALVSSAGSLSITAPYQNLMEFFDILYRNHFPFVIQTVEITPTEENQYDVQLELAVYALPPQVASETPDFTDVTSDFE